MFAINVKSLFIGTTVGVSVGVRLEKFLSPVKNTPIKIYTFGRTYLRPRIPDDPYNETHAQYQSAAKDESFNDSTSNDAFAPNCRQCPYLT